MASFFLPQIFGVPMNLTSIPIKFVPITDIKIKPDRQRQEFNVSKLLELAESIKTKQMLSAINIDDEGYLVAGERRLKACAALHKKEIKFLFQGQEVPHGTIPTICVGKLDAIQAEELELDENLKRENLTWQEEAAALQRLVKLRGEQAVLNQTPMPTNKSIAKEVEKNVTQVQSQLVVARHLDDPDVAKAKTVKEATKIIERKAKEQRQAQQAAEVDTKNSIHELFHGDCREFVKGIQDSSISVIVTDPPYGINMHKDKSWDGTNHEYDDTEEYAFQLITDLIPEWTRCTKEQAHLYTFCDFDKFQWLRAIVESYRVDSEGNMGWLVDTDEAYNHLTGVKGSPVMQLTKPVWEVMYFPFIWNKGNVAAYPRPNHWPRKSYECILYAIKGGREQAKLDLAVIDIPQIQNQDHPAGKPEELYRHLLQRSALAGDDVLDCFVGQGNFFRACSKLNLIGHGAELSDKYINLAKLAIEECKV